MPKLLGSLYLRLRGRDPVLLNQLTYTTNWRLRKLLAALGVRQITDLNETDFLAECRGEGANLRSKKARLVRRLTAFNALSRPVLLAASLYTRLREGGSEMLACKEA